MMKPKTLELKLGPLPPSGLGPDGKLKIETEEERRQRWSGPAPPSRDRGNPQRPR